MRNEKNKGITLVVLIVTIIIMLILVAVVVNVIINGGLFDTAKETIDLKGRAEWREKLEAAKEAERIDSYQYPDTKKYPDVQEYFKRLEEEGLIEDIEKDIVDNGDDTYEVTTKEGHVFKVTETDDEILIEIIGDAKTLGPRIVKIIVKETTTNSIEIEVETRRAEDGTYTYKYKKDEEDDTEWKEAEKTPENTYKYTGLEANKIYNIKVEAKTKIGKTEAEIDVLTGELPTGTITFGDVIWSNGSASVAVTNTSEYQLQYQINDITGKWKDIENEWQITNLEHEDTVYARIWDGTNGGEYASVDVIDNVKPTVTIKTNTITSKSIEIEVTATDIESGMVDAPVYTYYIKKTAEDTYKQEEQSTNPKYAFIGLEQSTSYDIKVEVNGDNAGNIAEQVKKEQVTETITPGTTEGAIAFGETVWDIGEASITIDTNTNYNIEYQVDGITEGNWNSIEKGGQVTKLVHGNTVYARLTDGENSGDYSSIDIKDEIPPAIEIEVNKITSKSIEITATATDNQSGMVETPTYTYYIKETEENTYVEKETNTSGNYTFTELKQNTEYDVKVKVNGDKAGNSNEQIKARQKTETIISALEKGAITFGDVVWSNGTASTTISTNTQYNIEYQINGITEGNWTGIENGGTVSNIANDTVLYARLTDGKNAGEYASLRISNAPPVITTSALSSKTTNSLTVNVNATDINADKITYTLYVSTSATSGFASFATSSNNTAGTQVTLTATGLTQFTQYYFYVTANDGKATTTGATSVAIRTYCPGTGYTCTTSVCNGTQLTACPITVNLPCNGYCSYCNGVGTVNGYCYGNLTSMCIYCGGRGYTTCTVPQAPLISDTRSTCPYCGYETLHTRTYYCSVCRCWWIIIWMYESSCLFKLWIINKQPSSEL